MSVLQMGKTAFSSPAYNIEVDVVRVLDKTQHKNIAEFSDMGEIPPRMRACVNCIGSCGVKSILLESFPTGVNDEGIILGTGCHGLVGGIPAKKISNAGNISRIPASVDFEGITTQHAGYVYKDLIKNMKVKKLYIIMKKNNETTILKLDDTILDLGGEKQIVTKLKDAKAIMEAHVISMLEDAWHIFFISNSKTHWVIRKQDLRRKVRGSKIDTKGVTTWEEYQKKCSDMSGKYSEILDSVFQQFLEADEEGKQKKFNELFDKMGLSEHVAEFSDQDTAISYLFPNQTRNELYRGLISNHVGEMV